MIVRWPGRTEPGSVQPRYVMIEDFYPSIMEMAGLSADSIRPDGKRIDGISFVPLIDGTSDPRLTARSTGIFPITGEWRLGHQFQHSHTPRRPQAHLQLRHRRKRAV